MGFEYLTAGPELPLVAALFAAMLLIHEGGYRVGRRAAARAAAGTTSQVNVVAAATLALLALLVSFSLNMAVTRYDARRQLVVTEATAISRAHLRARLLPSPEGPELARQVRRYVDLRLASVARLSNREAAGAALRNAEALQAEMLAAATRLARKEPRPAPVEPLIQALKEIIDVHERRVSAFESFVPDAVLYLVGLAALGGAIVMGYGCGVHGRRNGLATTVYAVLICLAILVIVDLDRPEHGLIRVSQRSLERLQAQLADAGHAGPTAPDRFAGIPPVRYRCDDGEVLATFVQADPPAARIERDGTRWVLPLQRSASGARYSDGTVTFWEHHGEGRLEREGRAVTCRPGT
jgi:membrane-bound inhibitor of C-type lysozyme